MVTMFVLTTHKQKERTDAQEATFLKYFPHWYLTDTFGHHCIKTTSNDSYSSQLEKWYWFFRNFNCLEVNSPYVMLIDNDTFVNYEALTRFINLLPPITNETACNIYGQILSKQTDPQNDIFSKVLIQDFKYFSGGAGILFSKKFLEIFCTMINEQKLNPFSFYCDVMLGAYLHHFGVDTLVNHEGFHSQPPSKYGHTEDQMRESITYHYIKPEEMAVLEKICNPPKS